MKTLVWEYILPMKYSRKVSYGLLQSETNLLLIMKHILPMKYPHMDINNT